MISNAIYDTLFKKAFIQSIQSQYIDIQDVISKNADYFNEVMEEYVVVDKYEDFDNYIIID